MVETQPVYLDLGLKSGCQKEKMYMCRERAPRFSIYKSDNAATLPQSLLGLDQVTTSLETLSGEPAILKVPS